MTLSQGRNKKMKLHVCEWSIKKKKLIILILLDIFVKHNTKHKAGRITAQHCTVLQWYIPWYGAYFVYVMQNLFQLQKSLFNLHII